MGDGVEVVVAGVGWVQAEDRGVFEEIMEETPR